MSALHHEVTPTFNNMIYDSLQVLREFQGNERIRQELETFLSDPQIVNQTVSDIYPQLYEVLSRHMSVENSNLPEALEPHMLKTVKEAYHDIIGAVEAVLVLAGTAAPVTV